MAENQTQSLKLTPMMEQYRSVKKTLSRDTILFFRLGDFYEMFFEDAVKAAEILNITLTGREAGEAGRVPMCGIPYHSCQGYIKTLIDHQLKVAICEQIGDPKPAKGLVERKITRIISPATYLEEESKDSRAEYMAALKVQNGEAAMAYLELSTGEFRVREMPQDKLLHELVLLNPRELILPKKLADQENWMNLVRSQIQAGVTVYEDWIFEAQEGERLLTEGFKLASARSLSFFGRPLAMSVSGAVLYYLRDHLHTAIQHVRLPELTLLSESMILDRQTQKSLELVSSLQNDRQGVSLLSVMDQTLTCMGGRALYHWMTHPLIQMLPVQERQDAVAELAAKTSPLNTIRELLRGIRDIERTLSRLNTGVANARDLVNLRYFLSRVPELKQEIQKLSAGMLAKIREQLSPFQDVQDLISRAIVPEPPLAVREGGMICGGFSPELDELRSISTKGKEWLAEFERREIERTGIRSLKIKYSQVFGYTIDISNANLHLVPPEYIRKQTLSNAERFIVPELVSWDEKISGAQDKIKMLEYQLFDHVRTEVLKHLLPLQDMARAIGELDAAGSLALTALQKKWVRPQIENSSVLEIRGGRHPIVESVLPAGQFVENDALMDGEINQLIVLTGPNMAGKSTYIRQVGLIVLLAQIGSFVPSASARIGMVDRVFTRIGAADDLARGESTFMVEMLETAHILRTATDRSLIILDEVGRGTATFDGVSIAWAICEHLAAGKVKPRTLFATHYHELTALEEHFPRIKNYHISVRESKNEIIFLRKVVRGSADRSYGIHVAKLAGIPPEVLNRASEILAVLESENVEATSILENAPPKKRRRSEQTGPTLFDVAPKPEPEKVVEFYDHPVLEVLKELDMNALTPLEALNRLAELQKLAQKSKSEDADKAVKPEGQSWA